MQQGAYCSRCGNSVKSDDGSCLSCGNITFSNKIASVAETQVVYDMLPITKQAAKEDTEIDKLQKQLEIERLKFELKQVKKMKNSPVFLQQGQTIINNNNIINGEIEEKSSCKRWVFQLLAFFFGSIGIQEFYRGCIGNGILAILFSWTGVPSICALIQIFTQKEDSEGRIMR
jgi:Predicted membrane protein